MDVNAGQTARKQRWYNQFQDLNWIMSKQISQKRRPPAPKKVIQQVLQTERVKSAMLRFAQAESVTIKEAESQAKAILNSMMTDVNPANVRPMGYLLRKVWRQMYEGIFVNEDGIALLRELEQQDCPVILLPTHKSHMDYIILSYICLAHNLSLPFVISGENLRIPLVGPLLARSGAFFIRRSFGGDELYKAIFYEYVHTILQSGCLMECFIEGGRSRSGKVLRPKAGFLSVVYDLVERKQLKDVKLVPISISYDKVIEGSAYVNELLGAKKRKETLSDFINAANRVVRLNFGSIDVNIREPISLREAIFVQRNPATSRQHALMSLLYKVLNSCNLGSTATATSIVAALLLTTLNRGIHIKEMVSRVEWLREQVAKREGRVARIFEVEPTPVIVDRALDVLGKLVQRQNSVLFGFKHRESLELSIYRNQIIHVFIMEALVAVAMASLLNEQSVGIPNAVDSEALLEAVREISQLFKLEFVYQMSDIRSNFNTTVTAMRQRGIVSPSEDGRGLRIDPQGKDTFMFLCMLLWPFVDIYWISISSLFTLKPDLIMEESRLVRLASRRAEALYYSGNIDFYEAVSAEAIKNAFAWCTTMNVINYKRVEGTGLIWSKSGDRLVQLHPSYQKPVARDKLTLPFQLRADDRALGSPDRITPPHLASPHQAPAERKQDTSTPVDQLMALAHIANKFRKQPMSVRDPEAVLKHYSDAKLSSERDSSDSVVSFLLRTAKL